ncbi:hypothetical protein CYMTET_28847 [Cymbomonas tetramitiformis]|uniref:Uncharacterized protein n=1 Tax=Cymbomonas tetramitiformis TaxID=36881 RepID=A0AAE0FM52_9CHLO|nr:hypothetical protein CYMTET_28847 [Cymbomonas tetramitiformis]
MLGLMVQILAVWDSPVIERENWTVRTKTFCKLLVLNRLEFYKVAERAPNELQRCQRNIYDRAKLKESLVLDQDARVDPIRRDVCRFRPMVLGVAEHLLPGQYVTLRLGPSVVIFPAEADWWSGFLEDWSGALHRAIQAGYIRKRQELITQICYLAASGNLNELRSAFTDYTLDINCADYDGRCALHLAAHNGHTAVITFLLSKGADPNVQDSFGNTPLWEAVKWNQQDACLVLKQAKAQLLLPDSAGVLCTAAYAADGALIRSLLQNGIDPNAADHDQRTCLHLASAEGILRTVKDMVMYGANVDCQDRWGHTPLSEAILHAHPAIADFLRENGAKEPVL